MVSVVIFDVDGTLMDTNYLHVEAWARAQRQVGATAPRSRIHAEIGKGSDQFLPVFVPDKERAAHANEIHGQVYKELEGHGYPLPGARELLRSLKGRGYRVWFATSAEADQLGPVLKALEAEDGLIDGIVSSADVEKSKPHPDLFGTALERAGVPAGDAVAVGDTVWDIQAAERAGGLRTVAVLTGGAFSRAELEHAGAVRVVEDCAELLALNFPDGF